MFDWLNVTSTVFTIIEIAYLVLVIGIAIVVLLENRNPVKSMSWILVLILLPGLGLILYLFFGQNLRKQKIISKKSIKQIELVNGYYDRLKRRYNVHTIDLPEELACMRNNIGLLFRNNHALLTEKNNVELLLDGETTFQRILEAISGAKSFIHIEYYIIDNDKTGNQLFDLLIKKAAEGIEVRVIVDDVGSWEIKRKDFDRLKRANVQIFPFLMVRFPYFTSRINYRNHRKIVVVDGVVGFVGGINIADRYRYGLPEGGSWRDTHLRIEGNAVTSLQSVFILDWFFVSRQRIRDKRYFPDNSHIQGSYSIQIASSGPDSDFKTIEQAFFRTIASARRYVYIQSPYFLPTEPVLMAIRTAALSGTDVRIMLPGISDAIITSASTNSYIKEMLLSGVKVYFYAKGFLHAKTLVSDDVVSTVGTTNMDFRSFDYNFEVNAFVYNREFAQKMKHTFEIDMHDCHEIKLAEWNRRPLKQKISESVARLFSPLL